MLPLLLTLACAPAPDDSAPAAGPTYYRDVRTVLDHNCARCHADAGTETSFDDPARVASLAELIVARVDAGEMPPPAPDPSCREYASSDRYHLAEDEAQVLRDWLAAGTPLGDPADAPAPPAPATLAPFDLELRPDDAYVPAFGEDPNDYRCFRLDLNNDDAVFLTGLEALIDNPRIVHHVVLFEAPGTAGDGAEPDGQPGFECGGFGEDGWDFVAGWAPGADPLSLPEGMGIKLGQDAHLVLQMHYFRSAAWSEGDADRSGYGLTLTDDVDDRVYVYPLGTFDFTIPAGDPDYTSTFFVPWDTSWPTIDILGVFPHMHQLATGFDMYLARADASQDCLVWMDDWDFHNQVNALYTEPARLGGGDILSLTCRWDNSADNPAQTSDPPVDVSFGEGTQDEMCFGFTYGRIVDDP